MDDDEESMLSSNTHDSSSMMDHHHHQHRSNSAPAATIIATTSKFNTTTGSSSSSTTSPVTGAMPGRRKNSSTTELKTLNAAEFHHNHHQNHYYTNTFDDEFETSNSLINDVAGLPKFNLLKRKLRGEEGSFEERSPFLGTSPTSPISQKTLSVNSETPLRRPSMEGSALLNGYDTDNTSRNNNSNTNTNNNNNNNGAEVRIDAAIPPNDKDTRSIFQKMWDCIRRRRRYFGRNVFLDGHTVPRKRFPPNVVKNQKYNIITFVPMVLFEQFKFFFNLYFLIVALTQFIPILKIGFLFTYVAPLVFVLSVTLLKEAFDDLKRFKRDVEANSQKYLRLTEKGLVPIPSSRIKVGHLIVIKTNQRVPADAILLRTTEKSGASFIRTDQLDGETDWKLRHAVSICQKLPSDNHLLSMDASVYAEAPRKDIYEFIGTFTHYHPDGSTDVESLNLENTLWANTVVASGTVVALVVYTGKETRSAMNASSPKSKVGLLDHEINFLSKLLFSLMVLLSVLMVALNKFAGLWYIQIFRFLLLFSSIIPISMRVNLDMGKTMYSYFIMRDKKIPDTVVRNSSIPEELGRIEYLFSDKTGTLTQNEMVFKKLHLGGISFSKDTLDEIDDFLRRAYKQKGQHDTGFGEYQRQHTQQVRTAITALALCHNVTPVVNEDGTRDYQASSPDEVAMVKFSESVGLTLEDRSLTSITLKNPLSELEEYEVLNIFPFTSETKRMGIIVRNKSNDEITFYMKGADVVMTRIVQYNEWLEEECDNMSREGLRTLVFAKKNLSRDEYEAFAKRYKQAKATLQDRSANVQAAIESIENDLTLIGVTGVEDKLQNDVQNSLENLRNAGIKVWMLTGDKIETATCIARSAKLIARSQRIFTITGLTSKSEAEDNLDRFASEIGSCLIIDGKSLQVCLDECPTKFIQSSCKAPSVVCCRCSPTQKAAVVSLVNKIVKKRTAAIGDGGNDVSMIQAAHVGLGIVGKEGKQASLAADFSLTQFSHCTRLILWHGRNSYKRSARLSQFVIHRGLIISFIQAVFSSIFYYAAIPIYTGWLMVGYATWYTMLPVFSLVLDEDVREDIVFTFPELYRELQKGRALSYRTFLIWIFKSLYQGGVIMLLTMLLFENSFLRIVSITFTSLILTELLMVSFEVHRFNKWILLAELISVGLYFASIFLLPTYFDTRFILTIGFWWKVAVVVVCSCLPVYIAKWLEKKFSPPAYAKLA